MHPSVQSDEIDLRQVVRVLGFRRRTLQAAVLAALLSAGAFATYRALMLPRYEAVAFVGGDPGNPNFDPRIVAEIRGSDRFLERVASRVGGGLRAGALRQRVRMSVLQVEGAGATLRIACRAYGAVDAQRLAQAAADVFLQSANAWTSRKRGSLEALDRDLAEQVSRMHNAEAAVVALMNTRKDVVAQLIGLGEARLLHAVAPPAEKVPTRAPALLAVAGLLGLAAGVLVALMQEAVSPAARRSGAGARELPRPAQPLGAGA